MHPATGRLLPPCWIREILRMDRVESPRTSGSDDGALDADVLGYQLDRQYSVVNLEGSRND
jgi:hypothetical protein